MNSGFDADTLPTVVELSVFSRFDGVHAPSFAEGQTISVVTSFRRGGAGSLYSGALFAAGAPALAVASAWPWSVPQDKAAAESMVREYENLSKIRLFEPPVFANRDKNLFGPREAPPMWFGTAESIGLEFEFYGPSFLPLPQSVHAGYRRKEFLIAPLALSEERNQSRPWVVHTPSVLAVVNAGSASDASPTAKRRPTRVQFFATGKAAVQLGAQQSVRNLFLEGLVDPPVEKKVDPVAVP
jgi:hypothetical protein